MGGGAFEAKLDRAMKDGKDAEGQALIQERAPLGGLGMDGCIASPLISAVFAERADYLEALLAAGADPNQRDLSRKGSSYNLRALEAALWFEREDLARILLAHGATKDFGTHLLGRDVKRVRKAIAADRALLEANYVRHDYTLLHVAALIGDAPLAELFVELGLDPNAVDGDGHAPLRYAARNEPCVDVLDVLGAAGADINHCLL